MAQEEQHDCWPRVERLHSQYEAIGVVARRLRAHH